MPIVLRNKPLLELV